ncbi:MAG: SDR family oxidoreductase [Christensenellaceae bacterium]|jgi:NAD(P)-dependent dehydrogenase (short-subunit alcohol dehydrogenase family)|nr:SDR family oxidoreductase [Christensenellaceae bacterium]
MVEKKVYKKENSSEVVVITGAAGVLCSVIARDFVRCGKKVALVDVNEASTLALEKELSQLGTVKSYIASVLDKESLIIAQENITKDFGVCDILINGAGGNNVHATTSDEIFDPNLESDKDFFKLLESGVDFVFDLNFKGAFLTTQVFSKQMALRGSGSIINISSMNAYQPLTKIPAYSAAKAAISNFTQWLAVYFAKAKLRVNAIAPGFFATNQNKTLLFNPDGSLTPRSLKIISKTPMNRFGEPSELLGAIRFLTDDSQSSFITGIVIPIDGGFSAYSGV